MSADSATPGILGPGAAPPGRVRAFLRLVMIEHSVFALPFAYIASLTAMELWDGTVHWLRLLLVTVAMVGLRTFAMACNRIIDREIDARNPRTAGRELVTWYGLATDAGFFFWLGLVIVAAAFGYEHSVVRPGDLSRLNRAFFTVNGFVGIALFCCALLDLLVRGLSP
ncbi:UbiA family prenyltransferase [Streptomyces sp. MCAF7]